MYLDDRQEQSHPYCQLLAKEEKNQGPNYPSKCRVTIVAYTGLRIEPNRYGLQSELTTCPHGQKPIGHKPHMDKTPQVWVKSPHWSLITAEQQFNASCAYYLIDKSKFSCCKIPATRVTLSDTQRHTYNYISNICFTPQPKPT